MSQGNVTAVKNEHCVLGLIDLCYQQKIDTREKKEREKKGREKKEREVDGSVNGHQAPPAGDQLSRPRSAPGIRMPDQIRFWFRTSRLPEKETKGPSIPEFLILCSQICGG